ncbi:hypothetical protein D3C80_661760 [compost metagenome]
MIDGVHLPALHHLEHAHRIANRTEGRHQLHRQVCLTDALLQLDLDAVQVELRMIEKDQHRGFAIEDLPAQLGTDRAASAGHHHHLASDAPLQQFGLGRHRIATEQIGDVDVLQVLDLDPTAGQIRDIRHRAHRQGIRLEHVQNLAATRTGSRWNRQQDLLGAGFLQDAFEQARRIHRQAGNHPMGQLRVIIDEGHRAPGTPHAQRMGQLVASQTGPIDRHLGQAGMALVRATPQVVPVPREVLTHGDAQATDQQQTQQPIVEDHRRRNHPTRDATEEDQQGQQQRRKGHSLGDRQQRRVAEAAHHCPVHPQANEQWQGHRRCGQKQPDMAGERLNQARVIQAHIEGKPQSQPYQRDIHRNLQQTLPGRG